MGNNSSNRPDDIPDLVVAEISGQRQRENSVADSARMGKIVIGKTVFIFIVFEPVNRLVMKSGADILGRKAFEHAVAIYPRSIRIDQACEKVPGVTGSGSFGGGESQAGKIA